MRLSPPTPLPTPTLQPTRTLPPLTPAISPAVESPITGAKPQVIDLISDEESEAGGADATGDCRDHQAHLKYLKSCTWAQCDLCDKWRRCPPKFVYTTKMDTWTCGSAHRDCDEEEDEQEEGEVWM